MIPDKKKSTLNDGHLRLDYKKAISIEWTHLLSGVYGDEFNESSKTHISGYTEWISRTHPVISISWDWKIDCSTKQLYYLLTGKIFSNLMLTHSTSGADLGYEETNEYLLNLVHHLDWEKTVSTYIEEQYQPARFDSYSN